MASWANLFGYQATWFAVAWSAGPLAVRGSAFACIAFIGVQWRCSHARRADARVVLAALACGLLVDGIAARTGLLAYASAFPPPAPAWIVLVVRVRRDEMNHSMAWFAPRPWRAAAFAAVGGPLVYLARRADSVRCLPRSCMAGAALPRLGVGDRPAVVAGAGRVGRFPRRAATGAHESLEAVVCWSGRWRRSRRASPGRGSSAPRTPGSSTWRGRSGSGRGGRGPRRPARARLLPRALLAALAASGDCASACTCCTACAARPRMAATRNCANAGAPRR